MFTGIVREVGRVISISQSGDTRITIACQRPEREIEIGASICCSGACLTAVARGPHDNGSWFAVDASAETLAVTTLKHWAEGTPVNLEPALKVGEELGGHIVSGHVDGLGRIVEVQPEGASHRVSIAVPASLGRFVAPKGSIAVDGISLTVNEVEDRAGETVFGLNIIPHTWEVTTLAGAAPGREVNLEIDLIARYVARLTGTTA